MRATLLCCVMAASACVNTTVKHLAEGCIIDSDCAAPNVCAFQTCHAPCMEDRDCRSNPDIQLCIPKAPSPGRVCALKVDFAPGSADAGICVRNSDCPSTLVCYLDGQCRVQCTADVDCQSDEVCNDLVCRKRSEVPDAGMHPCSYNSDCDEPLVCRDGRCAVECKVDRDCSYPNVCAMNRCEPVLPDAGPNVPPGYGQPCTTTSTCDSSLSCKGGFCIFGCQVAADCDSSAGECCLAHQCARGLACFLGTPDAGPFDAGSFTLPDGGSRCVNSAQCDDHQFCNGVERCVSGVCIHDDHSACDDGSPCTTDMCDETQRTCSYVSIGPQDADHDGHFATSCGAGGDDCDDNDPTVYWNAHELCDLKDNNCNGQVDENVWVENRASRQVVVPAPIYSPLIGANASLQNGTTLDLVLASDRGTGTLDAYRIDTMTLTMMSGPVPLIQSGTQWSFCNNGYGKHVMGQRLFSNGAQLLTTGLQWSAPGPINGCCSTVMWQLSSAAVTSGLDFSNPTNVWSDGPIPILGNAYCPGDPTLMSLGAPAAAWIPQRGVWQLFFGENLATADATPILKTGALQPDGGLDVVRTLYNASFTAKTRIAATSGVWAFNTPGGVFVVWNQNAFPALNREHIRWALFDTNVSAPLYGPFYFDDDINPNDVIDAWLDGTDVVLLLADDVLLMRRVHPADGSYGPRFVIPDGQYPYTYSFTTSQQAGRVDPQMTPGVRPTSGGLAGAWFNSVVNQGNVSTRLEFEWGRTDFDGGLLLTEVDFPPAVRGPVTLVTVDARHVGLLWVEASVDAGTGPLWKTLMECN